MYPALVWYINEREKNVLVNNFSVIYEYNQILGRAEAV
jgi:hypothetical protein